MATVTKGRTFTSGETVTPAKLNDVVDLATVTEIVNADIKSDAAIAGTKIAPAFGAQNITVGTADRSITNTDDFALAFGTNNSERMRIWNNGVVRIGKPGLADFQIDLGGTGSVESFRSAVITGNGTDMYFLNQQPGGMQFGTNNAERMRLLSGGQLLVGKTVDDVSTVGCVISGEGYGRFSMADGVPIAINRNTNGQIQNFRRSDAQIGSISVTTTATAFNTTSDYRLKQNVEPMVGGLAKLSALAPKTFEFKAEPNVKVDGFIAHEVQAVVPQAVIGEKDGEDMQGLDHSKLVPVLVAAVQELAAKVAALEAAQ
jgi:uncharacterized protein YaiE (UPF0345 family)